MFEDISCYGKPRTGLPKPDRHACIPKPAWEMILRDSPSVKSLLSLKGIIFFACLNGYRKVIFIGWYWT